MSTKATVPVFSPDGQLGDIPQENLMSALKAGFKQGVTMKTGDGKLGVVPADRVPDAAKAGLQIVPLGDQDAQHAGFWHSLYSDLAGMVSSIKPPLTELGTLNPEIVKGVAQGMGNDAERKAAGYSKTYRALAPIAGSVANVTGMEDAAKQGDIGGVAGHAAAPLAVIAGTAAAAKALPAVAKVAGPVSERMYQSALKPPPGSYSTAEVGNMVRTGLDSAIPVSEAGVDKLNGLVSDLNQKVSDQIAAGNKAGATVNARAVASRLPQTASKFATQVNPESDLAAIKSSRDEFLANQPSDIPVADAQALKQGTYQQLKARSYGELRSATVEAQKALARGIKEELSQQFPEIAGMNQKLSNFYGLDEALERAVRRQDNSQLVKLGGPMVGAGLKVATGSSGVGAAAGLMKMVIDDPILKSKLAIAISNAGKMSPATASARVAAYLGALSAASQADTGQDSGQGK